jgi:hypothetical protein
MFFLGFPFGAPVGVAIVFRLRSLAVEAIFTINMTATDELY